MSNAGEWYAARQQESRELSELLEPLLEIRRLHALRTIRYEPVFMGLVRSEISRLEKLREIARNVGD